MNPPKILLILFLLLAFYKGKSECTDTTLFHPGYFIVKASENTKVFFYATPDTATKKKAFFNSSQWVFVQKEQNGFGYVFFVNSKGQKSAGWLGMQYLIRDTLTITAKVGPSINGYFRNKGELVYAFAVQTKLGKGNPVEDGTPDEYTVFFSDEALPPINIGCCEARLVNEGDLNNNGTDELSAFQAPENGCVYDMTTYSFQNGNWKIIMEPFLIPTACDPVSDADIQKQIFKEQNGIYFYDIRSGGRPVKKKAILK